MSRVSSEASLSTRTKSPSQDSKAALTPRRKQAADKNALLKPRPFFSYYGGKWRDAKLYPAPEYKIIVEPFAGSAGYALRNYLDKRVILCELDPTLFGVWEYLKRATPKEILSIPDIKPNESVDDLVSWCGEVKALVGLWMNRGAASPRKGPSKWMRSLIRPGSFWGERVRRTIASQLQILQNWEVHNCSYANCPFENEATWFVDPPYMEAGKYYRFGSAQIDYTELANWCRSRPGQVIVCENAGADWLSFRPLAETKTTRADRRSKEVYWSNHFEDDPNSPPPTTGRNEA